MSGDLTWGFEILACILLFYAVVAIGVTGLIAYGLWSWFGPIGICL